MQQLSLSKINDSAYRVLAGAACHVGNLKLINGQWKFKAIGYEASGAIIPGGGPLTEQHNLVFASLDETELNNRLGPIFDE